MDQGRVYASSWQGSVISLTKRHSCSAPGNWLHSCKMSRVEISPDESELSDLSPTSLCRQLEEGNVLYFPETPFEFPAEDVQFLLSQRQSSAAYRKNIAYRPEEDRVTGVASDNVESERLRQVLGNYSRQVTTFLTRALEPYAGRWRLDYASFRPLQEKGREIKQKRRNDLLHVDAFPTRPTRGDRILRFFTNINPEESRHWVVGRPFFESLDQWLEAGFPLPPCAEPVSSLLKRRLSRLAHRAGMPVPDRTRYDSCMLDLHDFLKASESYQRNCEKEDLYFDPGSSWMVFTDLVPHAALSGRFALEQTFIVDRTSLLLPQRAPISVLEQRVGSPLTD